jgi:hypothetical protein
MPTFYDLFSVKSMQNKWNVEALFELDTSCKSNTFPILHQKQLHPNHAICQ